MRVNELLYFSPINQVDKTKVKEIAKSILENGWVGMPLVLEEGGYLITGSHRLEALSEIKSELDYNFEVPTIDIKDIFDEAGLDFEEIMEDEGCQEIMDCDFVRVLDRLPRQIKDKYGIDLH